MNFCKRLFRRSEIDSDVQEEIEFHIDMRAELNRESGMNPAEARRAARRQFGNSAAVREQVYDMNAFSLLESLVQDCRYAVRSLLKSKSFTITTVLTLALGIGGTTAIFTLIDAVMFRPLPVSDPARLYRVGDGDDTIAEGRHGRWGFFSFPLYER